MERLNLGTSLEAITARKEILLRRASEIQAHLNNDVVRLSESQGNLDGLREQLKSPDPNIGAAGSFKAGTLEQSLLKQMADLRREEAQLRMTEMEGSVRLKNVHSQFLALAAIMESNLQSTVRERRAAVESRAKELADINDELASVQDRESKWVTLKREDRILEQRYEFYQKKYEDAVASLAMERARIGNVVVVQPALDPLRTVGVSRSVFVLIAAILAAFAALSWATMAEFLDHRVRTVHEVERWLAAPAFAAVPFDKSAPPGTGRAARTFGNQQRRSLHKAALALIKALGQSGAQSVIFSGTGTGAGVTSIALQIAAHVRAIFDRDVAIVELDAGRATLCDTLGLDPQRTWQAYLRGERALTDCLQDGPAGVKILASAPLSPQLEGDSSIARLAQLLHELEQRFDYVLLDMPPALERPEVLAAGQTVPPAVIVVEAERARHEMLQRIRTELAQEGVTLLGAILNKQRRYIPSWAYRAIVE